MRGLMSYSNSIPICRVKNTPVPNPVTVGEHLLNKRIELQLFPKEVAEILGIPVETYYTWESNGITPLVHLFPSIIEFLGYFPFDIDTRKIGGEIKRYRYCFGLTQEEMAKALGIDNNTISNYELEKNAPLPSLVNRIRKRIYYC